MSLFPASRFSLLTALCRRGGDMPPPSGGRSHLTRRGPEARRPLKPECRLFRLIVRRRDQSIARIEQILTTDQAEACRVASQMSDGRPYDLWGEDGLIATWRADRVSLPSRG